VTRIEPMTADAWPRIREIYTAGIAGDDATFETEAPEWARRASRL
jgi:L-amino acid N-acyltransferase YncA